MCKSIWRPEADAPGRAIAEDRTPRRTGGSVAMEPSSIVVYGGFPAALRLRHRVGQRRPIGCRRFPRRTGVPWTDSAIEIRGLVRPVGLGGELVDRCRVDGVLALLRALGVAVVAAPLAEEIACQPLPIRAAPAAAFGRQGCPPTLAGARAPGETAGARLGELPVGLEGSRLVAPRLNARLWFAERGVRNEARRNLAAPVGDEGLKVHDVLRFRVATLECVGPERAARARTPVTSRQRGRSARRTRQG